MLGEWRDEVSGWGSRPRHFNSACHPAQRPDRLGAKLALINISSLTDPQALPAHTGMTILNSCRSRGPNPHKNVSYRRTSRYPLRLSHRRINSNSTRRHNCLPFRSGLCAVGAETFVSSVCHSLSGPLHSVNAFSICVAVIFCLSTKRWRVD